MLWFFPLIQLDRGIKGKTLEEKYNETRGKKFSVKIKYKQGWACKKYRNKDGIKAQEDYPAAEKLR